MLIEYSIAIDGDEEVLMPDIVLGLVSRFDSNRVDCLRLHNCREFDTFDCDWRHYVICILPQELVANL